MGRGDHFMLLLKKSFWNIGEAPRVKTPKCYQILTKVGKNRRRSQNGKEEVFHKNWGDVGAFESWGGNIMGGPRELLLN